MLLYDVYRKIRFNSATQQTLLPRSFSEPVLHSFELLCLTLGAQCLAEFLDHSELNVQQTSWLMCIIPSWLYSWFLLTYLSRDSIQHEGMIGIHCRPGVYYIWNYKDTIYIHIHIFADTNTNPWNLIHASMHILHTVHPEPQFYFVSAVHGWFWCAACFSNLVDKKWQEYPRTPWVLRWFKGMRGSPRTRNSPKMPQTTKYPIRLTSRSQDSIHHSSLWRNETRPQCPQRGKTKVQWREI